MLVVDAFLIAEKGVTELLKSITNIKSFLVGTSTTSTYPYQLKRNHGALAIFGWGVLLPIGAIIARYCRQWDPIWYYLHVIFQFAGFIVGLAGVVAGISLYNRLHSDVKVHRGLGIFILVLGTLQVSGLIFLQFKNSKYFYKLFI